MKGLAPRKRSLVLATVILGAAIGVGIASAVVTSTVLADTNLVREKIVQNQFTPDASQPTFMSGWHFHPGLAVVQVQEGRLTITQNCQTKRVGPGDTSIEVPFLPVNATTSRATKWTTTFVLVDSTPGSPDRVAATEPSCPRGDDDDNGGH